jgi:hypothetical protein
MASCGAQETNYLLASGRAADYEETMPKFLALVLEIRAASAKAQSKSPP